MTETKEPLAGVKVGDVIQLESQDRTIPATVIARRYRHLVVQSDAGELHFDYSGHEVSTWTGKTKRIESPWKASLCDVAGEN